MNDIYQKCYTTEKIGSCPEGTELFIEEFLTGCYDEICEYWLYDIDEQTKLRDFQFHYGELSFTPVIVNALRKLTPIILTEYQYNDTEKDENNKSGRIDFYFMIKMNEYFAEIKLLDLGKKAKLALNKAQRQEVEQCFNQIDRINELTLSEDANNIEKVGEKFYKMAIVFLRTSPYYHQKYTLTNPGEILEEIKNISIDNNGTMGEHFDYFSIMKFDKDIIDNSDEARKYPFLAACVKIEII